MSDNEISKKIVKLSDEYEEYCSFGNCRQIVIIKNCVNSGPCWKCKKVFCQKHCNMANVDGCEIAIYCDDCGYPNYSYCSIL